MFRLASKKLLARAAIGFGTAAVALTTSNGPDYGSCANDNFKDFKLERAAAPPPSREALLDKLRKTNQFDVLVIGGGAAGAGSALDASTRGLNVALLEMNDFASGTSSKSTKMAHGGVRYLEKAVWELSKAQLDLVIEALNERAHMLETAPHLCKILPIMIPVYKWWQVPYFYVGTKMYDFFAGSQNLKSSYLLFSKSASQAAPMLDASKLKAGLVYHDGSFNDARMNSSIAITAIEHGATVLNYMEVKQLLKDKASGKVIGVKAVNRETGEEFNVRAKVVVNATGPFSDRLLQMDENPSGTADDSLLKKANESANFSSKLAVLDPKMVVPSAGVHVILPSFYCPKDMGLLDAETSDGRVMFFLPWQGKVLAGTTDIPMKHVPENPVATEADIQDILKELQHYVKFPVRREDVQSAWAGIRPLVKDPRKDNTDTQGLVRSHLVFTSPNGLVTISGGKWTTYREMAQDTINEVIKVGNFVNAKPCVTKKLKLVGAENWNAILPAVLSQEYGLQPLISEHLAENYGTRASLVCELFKKDRINQLPVTLAVKNPSSPADYEAFRYPYTIGELKYAINYEYARTPLDFLMRRTRYAFLDAKQALEAVAGTVKVMGDELNWDSVKREHETKNAIEFIKSFGV